MTSSVPWRVAAVLFSSLLLRLGYKQTSRQTENRQSDTFMCACLSSSDLGPHAMADRITAKATAIPCRPSMWPLLADKPPTGNTSLKIWDHTACVNPKLKVQDISRKNKLCPGEIVYFILVRRTSPRNSRKESDFMRQLGVEVLKKDAVQCYTVL